MSNPLLVVVGAGPGVGLSVARRFGRAGFDVGLVARSDDAGEEMGATLQAEGVTAGWATAEIVDAPALTAAITRFGGFADRIDVLHFNPSAFRQHDPLTLTVEELLEDVRLGVGGLLTALQAARPFLHPGARVTATGSEAADHPWNEAASLGVQKAGLRNLVKSIDATLAPLGGRAVSVTVNGTLGEGTPFSVDHVADAIYAAATQPEDGWRTEIPFNGAPGA